MYQITLSLKERQELVQALSERLAQLEEQEDFWFNQGHKNKENEVKESIAHLENIKEKVEQAKIVPVKGLTE